jgi:hypothetical protein
VYAAYREMSQKSGCFLIGFIASLFCLLLLYVFHAPGNSVSHVTVPSRALSLEATFLSICSSILPGKWEDSPFCGRQLAIGRVLCTLGCPVDAFAIDQLVVGGRGGLQGPIDDNGLGLGLRGGHLSRRVILASCGIDPLDQKFFQRAQLGRRNHDRVLEHPPMGARQAGRLGHGTRVAKVVLLYCFYGLDRWIGGGQTRGTTRQRNRSSWVGDGSIRGWWMNG